MSKLTSPTRSLAMPRKVSQVKFRIDRTIRDWSTATEMCREAAAEPGYVGPSIAQMEAIGQAIAALRPALSDWIC
jgi:hypothetical protein